MEDLTLKGEFCDLINKYDITNHYATKYWDEVENNFSKPYRFYHTMEHLNHIYKELLEVKQHILNWDSIIFSIVYHDFILDIYKKDNEDKSASLAKKKLEKIYCDEGLIQHCKRTIIATKSHIISNDSDINYFLDADLAILGSNWENYSRYLSNVRNEYAIFPKFVYNLARRKLLKSFLNHDKIFKTEYFFNRYEEIARANIQLELEIL
jgi:predicted metal-dependent HD superfamily phosphohydrolase